MLETKIFEIRDKGTFIPVVATMMVSHDYVEAWLLGRAGYGIDERLVLLTKADGGKSCYDPFDWSDRTYQVAHRAIARDWYGLITGDVIDVEYELGETLNRKVSERL